MIAVAAARVAAARSRGRVALAGFLGADDLRPVYTWSVDALAAAGVETGRSDRDTGLLLAYE